MAGAPVDGQNGVAPAVHAIKQDPGDGVNFYFRSAL